MAVRPPGTCLPIRFDARAFSMVEVVLAIGIMSFCVLAMLSLFSVGVITAKESDEEIRAANLMSSLICRMRSAPSVDLSSKGFPFGALVRNSSGSLFEILPASPLYLKGDGTVALNAQEAMSSQGYAVTASGDYRAESRVARVAITFWWPAAADFSKAAGKYRLTTFIDTEIQ